MGVSELASREAWVKHMEATLIEATPIEAALPSAGRGLGRAVVEMGEDDFIPARGPTEVWMQYRQVLPFTVDGWRAMRPETRDEVYLRVWAELLMLWRVFAANRGPDGDWTLYVTAHEQLSLVMANMMLGSPESTLAWLAEDPANEFALADRLAPRRLFAKIEQPEQPKVPASAFGWRVDGDVSDEHRAPEWSITPVTEDEAYERAMCAREREMRDVALAEMVAEHTRLATEHDKLRTLVTSGDHMRAHARFMRSMPIPPTHKNPPELKAAPSSFARGHFK